MHMTMPTLQYLYKNTAEESPLRKYITHRCAAATLSHKFTEECKDLFPEFLVDLVLLLKKHMPAYATADFAPSENLDLFEVDED